MKTKAVFRILGPVALLLPLLSVPAAFGAGVSVSDAARAAKAWVDRGFAMGKLASGRAVAGVDELEDPASGACVRVVRFEGGGYVVLSADDRVEPVIAFSETGSGLEPGEGNPFWVLLRGDIAAREAAAGVGRGGASAAAAVPRTADSGDARRKWEALLSPASNRPAKAVQGHAAISDVRVDSFVESRWGQSTYDNYAGSEPCFNSRTPNNYPCGCVATLLAQILRYWRHPASAVAAHSYECAVSGSSAVKTMIGGRYDWDSMPLQPGSLPQITSAQCQAIGKLTYDVGVSVKMDWGSYGSSASLYSGVACLPVDFGYANAKAIHFSDGYDPDLFRRSVIPNLDARCPCGLSVSGAGGHAVLVDGYGYSDGDFFIHLNMGWVGSDDAWYAPPKLATSSYSFNAVDGFLFNIFPDKTGSIASGRVLDAEGTPVPGASVRFSDGQTTHADANGIYAFIASPGSYAATASKDGVSATLSVTLGETTGTTIDTSDEYRGYFYSGTGSMGNSGGNDIVLSGTDAVAAPVFSPGSCRFYPSTNVTISCSDPTAAIRFTMDGATPSETSALYEAPIAVTETVTIKARAFAPGKSPSIVVSAVYTFDESLPGPPGDFFDRPIDIAGASGSHAISDISVYSLEQDEPLHTLDGGSAYQQSCTVWYRWKAPGTGTVTFRTSAESDWYLPQTFAAAYVGDSLSSAVRLGFATEIDDDWETPLVLNVTQGETYRIVGVMGNNETAAFTLRWDSSLVQEKTPYETWAEANGIAGGPSGTTGGVPNAFRYVFGRPNGAFSPIAGIRRETVEGTVLLLPPVANAEGATLKVRSTADAADWESGSVDEREISVGEDGRAVLGDRGDSVRFYRLEAEIAE